MSKKPKIVFFGTPHFAGVILKELIDLKKYKPDLVVTAPDRPVGRKQEVTPPPVKILAEKNKIPVIQPEKLSDAKDRLANSDLFIVAAFGRILPKEILEIPKYGSLNVHPSLLPKWRGPSPIQYAILHGDKTTGSSIILLDEQMDHGPLLAQEEFPLSNEDTAEKLTEKLAEQGAKVLIKTIPDWISGEIKPKEQEHEKATYTDIITRQDGRIDWHEAADSIERKLRAYTPWPGIFTFLNEKRLKILSLEVAKTSKKEDPGKIVDHEQEFAIVCGKGLIIPKMVQLEGKEAIKAKEFLKGHWDILGEQLI